MAASPVREVGVRATTPYLFCANTQCRVQVYSPHSSKNQTQKCPACYGTAS